MILGEIIIDVHVIGIATKFIRLCLENIVDKSIIAAIRRRRRCCRRVRLSQLGAAAVDHHLLLEHSTHLVVG